MEEQDSRIKVEIKRKPGCEDLPLPRYMTGGASGMDLHAAVEETTTLEPGEVRLIHAGIYIAVPRGFEAQVRPRSGLALESSVTVLNAPGTIDSDYRAEVGVVLANLGARPFVVERGMRVAQMVIARSWRVELVEVDELSETDRQFGGFGSTGLS